MPRSHNVTFLEAATRVAGAPGDVFDVYFGGSDAVVGTARVVRSQLCDPTVSPVFPLPAIVARASTN